MARKRKLVHSGLLLASLLLSISVLLRAYSTGPPSGYTGGFSEPNCTACHSTFPVDSGAGSVSISAPATYASGVTYPVTVAVSDPNQMRWGFELSVRTQGGQQAGTLIPGADGFTQLLASIGSVQYISHTSSGTRLGTTGGVSFQFQWIAPDVSAGTVVFNAAGNAANGNLNNTGDYIYTTSATSQPEVAPAILLSLTSLNFAGAVGGANPNSQNVLISNSGGGTLNWTASAQTDSGGGWLAVTPTSGTNTALLGVSVNTAGLAAGSYTGSVIIQAAGATNTPQTISVTLTLVKKRRGQLVSD
jgi:BACON domain-containing protein